MASILLVIAGLFCSVVAGSYVDDIPDFAARFAQLERQVAKQNELIARQGEQLLTQSKTMADLKSVVAGQESTISDLRHIVDKQQKQQSHQQRQQKQLEDLLKNQMAGNKRPGRFVMGNYETVAFHATIGQVRDHIDINQTLVFESVKLNIGGGYHASGGIFIAPVSGIYIFSTSVTFNDNNDESHVIIEKNGAEIAGAYGSARTGAHEQGSVTVVMELKAGDEVYVSNQRHNDVIVYGDNLSSFMGCMIVRI